MMIAGAGRISAVAANAVQDDDIATRPADAVAVSVVAPVERPPVSRSMARHDAFFIAQLIAAVQQSPQTRVLRRATPKIAHAAYHSANDRNQGSAQTGPRLLRVV